MGLTEKWPSMFQTPLLPAARHRHVTLLHGLRADCSLVLMGWLRSQYLHPEITYALNKMAVW